VQSRAINIPMTKSELIQVERMKKGSRRPKIIVVVVVVKKDMSIKELAESMILDKIE
jgi:hypothetical protein